MTTDAATPAPRRTVRTEVRLGTHALVALALVVLVGNLAARGWLLLRLAPPEAQLRSAATQLDALHPARPSS